MKMKKSRKFEPGGSTANALMTLRTLDNTIYEMAKLMPKSCRGVAKVASKKVSKSVRYVGRTVNDMNVFVNYIKAFTRIRELDPDKDSDIITDLPFIISESDRPLLIEASRRSPNNTVLTRAVQVIEHTLVESMINIFPDRPVVIAIRRYYVGHPDQRDISLVEKADQHFSLEKYVNGKIVDGARRTVLIIYNPPMGNETIEYSDSDTVDSTKRGVSPADRMIALYSGPNITNSCLRWVNNPDDALIEKEHEQEEKHEN